MFLPWVVALKFHLNTPPSGSEYKFCLSEYIGEETLVEGKFTIDSQPQQVIQLKVYDSPVQPFDDRGNVLSHDNIYFTKEEVSGKGTFSFSTHKFANILFCFTNVYKGTESNPSKLYTPVEFKLVTGADTSSSVDDNQNRLKPMEQDLERLANVAREIVENMESLQIKESSLRDVNGFVG